MPEPIVVFTTVGSQHEAKELATTLVAERLAACVSVVPHVTSIYRWEGKVEQSEEWLLIAKTRQDVLAELVERLRVLHSYEVPEAIAIPVLGGSDDYLQWLDQEVR